MTQYSADLQRMQSLIEHASAVNDSIAHRVRSVESRIDELHYEWNGNAAAQHLANVRRWNDSMHRMRSELASLSSAVQRARASYVDAARHVQQIWPS